MPKRQEIRVLNEGDGVISAFDECHMNYSIDSYTAKVLLVMIGIDDISPTKPCQLFQIDRYKCKIKYLIVLTLALIFTIRLGS